MLKKREIKFRTEIKIPDAPVKLDPGRQVLLVGSCFSDNIGGKMLESDLDAIVNPCGTVYNPLSIYRLFEAALSSDREEIILSSLTVREGNAVSWLMGKKGMGATDEECVGNVDSLLSILEKGIRESQAIIITFGTSDVWFLNETSEVVGNCHKHPAREFGRRRMSISEIVDLWAEMIDKVRSVNPDVQIIFTVSPRRYLSDGFQENTRQKAVLILACDELCRMKDNVSYFPAYEIMNDDLRDYRFYKPDLLHPSDIAVEYIWQKFKESFI